MILYHGSPVPSLNKLEPRRSTHGKPYVYAATNIVEAMMYCSKWNDFMLTISKITTDGITEGGVIERYEGALKELYKGKKGFVYIIDGSNFLNIDHDVNNDLVSEVPVDVLDYIVIDDLYKEIIKREDIYHYPNKPSFIPVDDSDLIIKAFELYEMSDDIAIFRYFREKFPHLGVSANNSYLI